MIDGIRLLLLQFLCSQKSRADLQAENLMLRHQIGVLRRCRSTSKRVRTTKIDRLSFVWLYRLWPTSINALQIIHPKLWCAGIVRVQGVLVLEVALARRKAQSQCRAPGICHAASGSRPALEDL